VKILMPVHVFLPDHHAGTEVYTFNLAKALQARGHEVHVFTTEKELSRRSYGTFRRDLEGVPVHVMVNNLDYESFEETFVNPQAEGAFQRVFDEVKPQVVHVQHLMLHSMNMPAMARAGGARVLMTLNDFWLYCPRFGQLLLPNGALCPGPSLRDCHACLQDFTFSQGAPEKVIIRMLTATRELTGVDLAPLVYWAQDRSRWLKKRRGEAPKAARAGADGGLAEELRHRMRKVRSLIEQVDVFLSPSNTVAERVIEWGIPRAKVRVSRYGIDTHPFEGNAPQEREDARVTFGFIGTIAPHKGVHVLVDAMRRLPKGAARLLVFGSDGSHQEYGRMLRDLAEGHDIEFCGPVDRSRIAQAFGRIDCLVMPSLWLENSPVVIQEAFAAGVPVIASGQGGMAELIDDGRSGRLFPAGDTAALAEHMAAILANPTTLRAWSVSMDPPRKIEDDAAGIESLYEELLSGKFNVGSATGAAHGGPRPPRPPRKR
jgi:glycosyltransferase involved in cell wall biosynthesis